MKNIFTDEKGGPLRRVVKFYYLAQVRCETFSEVLLVGWVAGVFPRDLLLLSYQPIDPAQKEGNNLDGP